MGVRIPSDLISTDNLCPDCTTPIILLDSSLQARGTGALCTYHDADCVVARLLDGPTVSDADRRRVAETRRRSLDEALEVWSELA